VSREPAQCLRYCFEDGEEPLWPSRQPAPKPDSIPPCTRCGAARCASPVGNAPPSSPERATDGRRARMVCTRSARRFEFQAMPQLLNYLDIDADDASALDFGTIAVYRRARLEAYAEVLEMCADAVVFDTCTTARAAAPRAAPWMWMRRTACMLKSTCTCSPQPARLAMKPRDALRRRERQRPGAAAALAA
jgi:hypothetical protein